MVQYNNYLCVSLAQVEVEKVTLLNAVECTVKCFVMQLVSPSIFLYFLLQLQQMLQLLYYKDALSTVQHY